jgi:hypothetical protein
MPKIGPFRALAFNSPTAQTEDLYFKSINTTVDQYRTFLQQVRADSLAFPNSDLDTGKPTTAAEYSLTDETYAKLLTQLSDRKFDLTTADLQNNILQFYSDLSVPIETKKDNARWSSLVDSLDQLKLLTPNATLADSSAQRSVSAPITSVAALMPPSIVIGFVGGFVKHDNFAHTEVQLAARLRKAYSSGVEVDTFENSHGEEARRKILDLLDTNRDGALTKSEKQNARVIIYGHSWGGSEAITLARELEKDGVPVLLTVQVDSVSKLRQDDELIPANVVKAANFYQTNGRLHGRSTIRAADPRRTSIIGNFQFDYKASSYKCKGYPWYNRIFAKSHTQIECDPAVWEKAESLIRADLPPMTGAVPENNHVQGH